MLLKEELEAFERLEFVLECQKIRLRQLGSKRPRIILGPGKILQKADGKLYFETYVQSGRLPQQGTDAVGEVLPRSRYYSLKALDWRGRQWNSPQVEPTRHRGGGTATFSVLVGELRLLKGMDQQTQSKPDTHSITGYVFAHDVSVPANERTTFRRHRGSGSWSEGGAWDVAKFEVDGTQVHFEHDPGRMLVRATRKGPAFPPSYSLRILEALRFVTGAMASWSVVLSTGPKRTEAALHRVDRRTVGVNPPIARSTTVSAKATEEMFRCYLNYVLAEPRPHWFHRLSAEWGEILRASQGTLQTQAAIWCIVVEALLDLIVRSRRLGSITDPSKRRRIRVWRGRVLGLLEAKKCPTEIRDRFRGVTNRMLEPSSREVMKRLELVGAINMQLEARWSKLRHPSAHADRQGQGETDALFKECMAVLSLLHQLTFFLIRYKGWFSDYSSKGWPLKQYPFK